MSCADVQTIQAGDGSKVLFSFDFPYIFKSEIHVYLWNTTTKEWDEKLTTDATYPWQITDANPTIVEFTGTVPPSPTTPTDPNEPTVDNVRIRRITNVDDIRALFNPGSAIRSDDLNKNFEQLRYAIQEANCQGIPDDVDEYLKNYYWNKFDSTVYSTETWDSDDDQVATTQAIDARIDSKIDSALTVDIIGADGVNVQDDTPSAGQITVGLSAGSVDLDRIKADDIVTSAEQDADYDLAGDDDSIFTSLAAVRRFENYVQTTAPSGTGIGKGRVWVDTDDDLTLSVWNGSNWVGITSGGTFTNQPKVVYVDASSGDDGNDGHRISRPKKTIKAAINQINADATYGDGSVVVVAPGVYQEAAPIDITRSNVSIVGAALRSCIVHPTVATETNTLFRVNSGTYLQNLTFTGVKASGALGNSVDATLPVNQGWNVAFYPGATIIKSPYIQNCTNFSDSEIDNSNINVITPAGGAAGDTDSAPTGGGLLVDGSTVDSASPLRSMVCDSYTHVGLNGPGILVTNNGYVQATSSYAFFNKYHIKTLNGGQANLAASTTDFGDQALVADGKSTTAIFTAALSTNANDGDITFTIDAPVADASWHGTATRPQTNMLVELNSIEYPILSATANGAGWDVTISRPNPNNKSENLGLNGAVTTPSTASFYLRSMIASSGHTMEYVGSGTNYSALPENGGVPDETKQITESNNGKIWTAITDHNGKFKIGGNQTDDPIFEIDQQLGFVTIPEGSIAFNLLSDLTPQLGGNLDANGNDIILDTGAEATPSLTFTGDTNTGIYSPGADQVAISTSGSGRLFINSTGKVGLGTSSPYQELTLRGANEQLLFDLNTATNGVYGSLAWNGSTSDQGTGNYSAEIRGYREAAGAYGALAFHTRGASGVSQEHLRITSDGKLGLGTGSPARKLTVTDGSIPLRIASPDSNMAIEFVSDLGTRTNWLVGAQYNVSNSFEITPSTAVGNTTFSTPAVIVDSSGRVLVGSNAARSNLNNVGQSARFQLEGTSSSTNKALIVSNFNATTDAVPAGLYLARAGSTGVGSVAAVDADNQLGEVAFLGSDGTDFVQAAKINAEVEGTPGADNMPGRLVFFTNAGSTSPTPRMTIDSSGRLLVGTSIARSNLNNVGQSAAFQLEGTSSSTNKALIVSNFNSATDAVPAGLYLARAGSTGVGSTNVVAADNQLGEVAFLGSDGTDFVQAAQIKSEVDGTPAADNMPGRLVFSTNPGSPAPGPTERMIIDSSGRVGIGTTSPSKRLQIGDTTVDGDNVIAFGLRVTSAQTNLPLIGHTSDGTASSLGLCATSGSGSIQFFTGNGADGFGSGGCAERARIDTSGRLLVGTSTSLETNAKIQVQNGHVHLYENNDAAGACYEVQWSSNGGATGRLTASMRGVQETTGASGGRLVFSTTASGASNPTERMKIDSAGNLYVNVMQVGGTANVHWSSSAGQLFVTSSSERFKHDIVDYDKGLNELMQMQPKYFVYNDEPNQKQRAGFIAEDFHDLGLTEYVEYWNDDEGNATVPSEIGYANMVAILVKSIQQQQAMIAELQTKVAALEAQ